MPEVEGIWFPHRLITHFPAATSVCSVKPLVIYAPYIYSNSSVSYLLCSEKRLWNRRRSYHWSWQTSKMNWVRIICVYDIFCSQWQNFQCSSSHLLSGIKIVEYEHRCFIHVMSICTIQRYEKDCSIAIKVCYNIMSTCYCITLWKCFDFFFFI